MLQIRCTNAQLWLGSGSGAAAKNGAAAILFKTVAVMRRGASGADDNLRLIRFDRDPAVWTDSGAHARLFSL